MIADEAKAVALAGVMGGQNSEINPTTVDVLIESACFQPRNIRATSKKLDLRTDSSYRFERGSDVGTDRLGRPPRGPTHSGNRRRQLLEPAVDAFPVSAATEEIKLRFQKDK